jgi:hypothetical protein
LGIYPKKSKSSYNRDSYILIFLAELFTRAKLQNQPRYLPINKENVEWIHNWVLLSHEEQNHVFTREWMGLEIIILSEIIQTKKDKYPVFSQMCNLEEKLT